MRKLDCYDILGGSLKRKSLYIMVIFLFLILGCTKGKNENEIKNKNNIDNLRKHMIFYQSCRRDINKKARSASGNY